MKRLILRLGSSKLLAKSHDNFPIIFFFEFLELIGECIPLILCSFEFEGNFFEGGDKILIFKFVLMISVNILPQPGNLRLPLTAQLILLLKLLPQILNLIKNAYLLPLLLQLINIIMFLLNLLQLINFFLFFIISIIKTF